MSFVSNILNLNVLWTIPLKIVTILHFCHALQFTCIIAFDPHSCCKEQPIIFPIWQKKWGNKVSLNCNVIEPLLTIIYMLYLPLYVGSNIWYHTLTWLSPEPNELCMLSFTPNDVRTITSLSPYLAITEKEKFPSLMLYI